MPNVAADGAGKLREMISGYMISQVICVMAALRLADLLATGAMSGGALAQATETDGRSLARLLRALTAWGLLEEREPERFNLSPLGALLRSDASGSLRNLALMGGGEAGSRAWANLLHAVRTGESAFEHVFGVGSFRYNALQPERAAIFDGYMADLTRRSVSAIVAAHDFSHYRRIVDVGGGNGALLTGILADVPEVEGCVFDTSVGVEGARRRLRQAGVEDRCQIVAGDFFERVPDGADAYILKSVLHDWGDDRAVAILENCCRAMRRDSKLLIVERLLPERIECTDYCREIVMMDIHMLVMQSGRERTVTQYAELFAAAGLGLTAVQPTSSPFAIMEAQTTDVLSASWKAPKGEGKQ
jgi:orsellinic acid C2-O-methyltransferase